MAKAPTRRLHLPLIIFLVCLLFTVLAWDHFFNSSFLFDRQFVSNLVLLMGTLFSLSAGLLVWSLERQMTAAQIRAKEAHEAYQKLHETQDQLIQSEKLASIGRIVAGVAHELKSPLITIGGYTNLLKESAPEDRRRHFVEIIDHQAKRCHQTVQDLLTYSHTKALRLEPVDLGALLPQILEEMPLEFRNAKIEIVKKFPPQIPAVQADALQLTRVFSNLITNAWHALEEVSHARRLTLNVLTGETGLQIFLSDNGPGIAKEDLDKIFEPFFTTKPAGKGTGLGLSLCYGIIREHGGKIEVQSEKGKGTTFLIELLWKPEKSGNAESRGTVRQKILIVDDEPPVLDFVSRLLNSWGYEAVSAGSGREALEKAWVDERIRLAVLDINLPGMDGFEIACHFRKDARLSKIPLIFLTGREEDEDLAKADELKVSVCLRKPFQYEELQTAVAGLLKPEAVLP